MESKKGFVTSLVAGGLILLLIILVSLLHNSYLESERAMKISQPIIYSKFFFNDVFFDVNKIVGPNLTINEQNATLRIRVSDTLPKANFSNDLEKYREFIENNFSSTIHANVSANFSEIEDGTLELFLLDGYLYNHSYVGDNEVLFGTTENNGKTNAIHYEINITVQRYRQSIQSFSWSPIGDMNVTITYTDKNGTVQSEGLLHSSLENTFKATLVSNDTRTIEISLGKINQREGAFWIKDSDASAVFSFLVELPLNNASVPASYQYNSILNYTQGNITNNGLVSGNN